jgi:hypothetical protein
MRYRERTIFEVRRPRQLTRGAPYLARLSATPAIIGHASDETVATEKCVRCQQQLIPARTIAL